MSWAKVYVHIVFCTKNRNPFLKTPELRRKVFQHIFENARSKDIWIDSIGGFHDHLHCMISLGKEQSISKIVQMIKGESSFWINKQNLTSEKFAWQDDYWAISVGENDIERVRKYIMNQERHHSKNQFEFSRINPTAIDGSDCN